MRIFILIALLFSSSAVCGQQKKDLSLKEMEEQLAVAFQKIDYWYQNNDGYDSLEKANADFEKLLLKYTFARPSTLTYPFLKLDSIGLIIATSEDGLFRIYSWNTLTGGSMHFYRTIFQYKTKRGTYSKMSTLNNQKDSPDAGCFYHQIDDVVSEGRTFYITQAKSVLSSAYTYHEVKVYSIDDKGLNDDEKLIKTKIGIKNKIGYEIDFSASSNRRGVSHNDSYEIEYDKATKTISIPLIHEDYKLTNKKIRYRFTGRYFEKV